jgi:L-fuconolactonase
MFVDSHQHFWQVGRFHYPWMTRDLGVLYQDYLPDALEPILARNEIEKTVLVQASNSLEETRWLLELADRNDFIAGVVGWVDLASPSVSNQLDEFKSHPKFKGVRHLVESEPDDDWLVRPAVLRGLNQLSEFGYSYDLLVHTRHLKHVPTIVRNCPDLRLVIDHLAKPPISRGEIHAWKAAFEPLAAFPTLSCKMSGLVTEAGHGSWTADDLRPYVEVALNSFGIDRLMFGSDYPVCLLAASYERVLGAFHEIVSPLTAEAKHQIFAENAIEFYQL